MNNVLYINIENARVEGKTYESKLFNSMLDIGRSSGRFDKNRDENLTFGARPRIAKLYDKQSNAISRNKDNCFGNISVFKKKTNTSAIRK